MNDLKTKYEFYCKNAEPDLVDCDSLLFTALMEGARPSKFDITRFRDGKGAWHRNVAHDCYSAGKSGSTISRDMLLGLLFYCWLKRRKDLVEDLLDYAWKHALVMGKGEKSRTLLNPNMLNTACHLVQVLGGKLPWYLKPLLKAPTAFPSDAEGYEAHLAVLHMLLRREMGVGNYFVAFEEYRKASPRNALFLYAAGYYQSAKKVLMDESLFPSYRMPTAKDRKEPWLWQRDHGPSWQPGKGDNVHTGGDLIFVAHMVLRDHGAL